MPATIAFTKVDLPYGWLGNMAPYPVSYNGVRYKTTEALFQSLRFDPEKYDIDLGLTGADVVAMIAAESSPMAAKMKAKKYKSMMAVKPGSPQDVDNMRLCLRLKIQQYPLLATKLKATGDALIVEDVTKRGDRGTNCFWGAMLVGDSWVGDNVLGRLWMDIRDSIQ